MLRGTGEFYLRRRLSASEFWRRPHSPRRALGTALGGILEDMQTNKQTKSTFMETFPKRPSKSGAVQLVSVATGQEIPRTVID